MNGSCHAQSPLRRNDERLTAYRSYHAFCHTSIVEYGNDAASPRGRTIVRAQGESSRADVMGVTRAVPTPAREGSAPSHAQASAPGTWAIQARAPAPARENRRPHMRSSNVAQGDRRSPFTGLIGCAPLGPDLLDVTLDHAPVPARGTRVRRRLRKELADDLGTRR